MCPDRSLYRLQAEREPIIFSSLLVKARNKHEMDIRRYFKKYRFFNFKSTELLSTLLSDLFVGQNVGFDVMIGQIACQLKPLRRVNGDYFITQIWQPCLEMWKGSIFHLLIRVHKKSQWQTKSDSKDLTVQNNCFK